MISFVIPAHNEEHLLPATLRSLLASARATGQPFEVLVVDDDSTDATAAIAIAHGARVVPVKLRKISAVRNAGAREARGHTLVFVDADTLLPEQTLRDALAALADGAAGGGARVDMGDDLPFFARLFMEAFSGVWFGFLKLAAGCFVFVRADVFAAVGGFDENFFAGEEMYLSRAIRTRGHLAILDHPVLSSGRKFHTHSVWGFLSLFLRYLSQGDRMIRTREGLDLWYDGKRASPQPHGTPDERG